jgi:hypothetical protein
LFGERQYLQRLAELDRSKAANFAAFLQGPEGFSPLFEGYLGLEIGSVAWPLGVHPGSS